MQANIPQKKNWLKKIQLTQHFVNEGNGIFLEAKLNPAQLKEEEKIQPLIFSKFMGNFPNSPRTQQSSHLWLFMSVSFSTKSLKLQSYRRVWHVCLLHESDIRIWHLSFNVTQECDKRVTQLCDTTVGHNSVSH